jgi:hypothetical protein
MNRVKVLYPYLTRNTWVFDDEATNLKEEAFVLGMTEIISKLVTSKKIENATSGFAMHFSDQPFDGYDVVMESNDSDMGGTWYTGEVFGEYMEGWLCPALFLYYETAPRYIYVKAENLPENVNPVWDSKNSVTKQYMAP